MGKLASLSVFDLHFCSRVDGWTEGWTYVGWMRRWKQRETASQWIGEWANRPTDRWCAQGCR